MFAGYKNARFFPPPGKGIRNPGAGILYKGLVPGVRCLPGIDSVRVNSGGRSSGPGSKPGLVFFFIFFFFFSLIFNDFDKNFYQPGIELASRAAPELFQGFFMA